MVIPNEINKMRNESFDRFICECWCRRRGISAVIKCTATHPGCHHDSMLERVCVVGFTYRQAANIFIRNEFDVLIYGFGRRVFMWRLNGCRLHVFHAGVKSIPFPLKSLIAANVCFFQHKKTKTKKEKGLSSRRQPVKKFSIHSNWMVFDSSLCKNSCEYTRGGCLCCHNSNTLHVDVEPKR